MGCRTRGWRGCVRGRQTSRAGCSALPPLQLYRLPGLVKPEHYSRALRSRWRPLCPFVTCHPSAIITPWRNCCHPRGGGAPWRHVVAPRSSPAPPGALVDSSDLARRDLAWRDLAWRDWAWRDLFWRDLRERHPLPYLGGCRGACYPGAME